MYEEIRMLKRVTETLKDQSRQNLPLETRNRFAPLQTIQDEVLDNEAKNYIQKETLQHRHQTPVYSKQNYRLKLLINHFPENDNPFGNKEQFQKMVNIATQCETTRKHS